MAGEILVKEPLTREMIEAGEELLRRLKSISFDVVAAFWIYTSEVNEWRLALAWPEVDQKGPREAYLMIWQVLYGESEPIAELDLPTLTVLSPKETLVRTLAGANQHLTLLNLGRHRLSDFYLNDVHVEDLYLYFIDESIPLLRGSEWYI